MEVGSKAWDETKKKSDELGVTKALDTAGSTIKNGTLAVCGVVSIGIDKVGDAIDSNPTLSSAKEKTFSTFKTAGAKIESTFNNYFGSWFKKP